MPFYTVSEEEYNQHLREHSSLQQPAFTELELQPYCSYCYSLFGITIPEKFPVFWDWLQRNYGATQYTAFTVNLYSRFSRLLDQGNFARIKQLFTSVAYQHTDHNLSEIVFIGSRLFLVTNQFAQAPSQEQIDSVVSLFNSPTAADTLLLN
jgi:hypothetical protein